MVTQTDLPERLKLFLTNSFSLPTMSEEFVGNNTWSVKVRRSIILARDIDFVHVPGGKDVATRAGYVIIFVDAIHECIGLWKSQTFPV
mmetsp:Transcript_1652/g.2930  ORF Transcript_1652/g.2930 Transcript_1652/m.2930 type:complete len:88 (-) Transcript_1652:1334-1597(-)